MKGYIRGFERNNNIITPCKYCERKGCGDYHSQCEEYIAYKKELEFERIQKNDEYYGKVGWKKLK